MRERSVGEECQGAQLVEHLESSKFNILTMNFNKRGREGHF